MAEDQSTEDLRAMGKTFRGVASFDLTGRTALVTGSSRGIGRALAFGLAQAGARVVVHGRDEARVRATAADIARATGAQTLTAAFDVTDADAVAQGIAGIGSEAGPLDILVNNAGMQIRGDIAEFSTADWDRIVATNLTSAFLLSRAVAPGMRERGTGRIVNIGSVQSQLARPGIAPYSATKGGIVMLTKGLAADLSGDGITVNAVAPGYFKTELTQALVDDAAFSAWVAQRTPAARWGEVADLLGPLVFLASDAAAFVTGQVLYVDGGMTSVL